MPYDPYEHADQLGLHVIEGNPGKGNRGLWAGNGIIIIRPGLTCIQFRCTLAHEIVHAEYDPPIIPRHLSPKAEAKADRIAAERLIDRKEFSRLAEMYFDNPTQLAFELGVTPKLLETYIKHHTP
ncbi:ImmA/IrrE family metallo-endopeptidase [Rothia amarae]|uniref:ImmA/IrrE family metallo-endopeptidase n=1 Tax=Rothia amarae TaxID=169480 RepID=A0A7H2BLS2_9MICC|nr:ImmA/IrrE family metallo-endopeptidase [Rothia amarae]QNV40618.1 ImmA/IrrE family metallo-endopeptidase [Rothia amarae]